MDPNPIEFFVHWVLEEQLEEIVNAAGPDGIHIDEIVPKLIERLLAECPTVDVAAMSILFRSILDADAEAQMEAFDNADIGTLTARLHDLGPGATVGDLWDLANLDELGKEIPPSH